MSNECMRQIVILEIQCTGEEIAITTWPDRRDNYFIGTATSSDHSEDLPVLPI